MTHSLCSRAFPIVDSCFLLVQSFQSPLPDLLPNKSVFPDFNNYTHECPRILISKHDLLRKCSRATSCVKIVSLPNIEGGKDFAPKLMRGNFPLLFLKDASGKDYMHARLCSDIAYSYNSQSSCMLVGQSAPSLCGTTL